jgi:hypothetical protein
LLSCRLAAPAFAESHSGLYDVVPVTGAARCPLVLMSEPPAELLGRAPHGLTNLQGRGTSCSRVLIRGGASLAQMLVGMVFRLRGCVDGFARE